jgi:uncharacterized membrane protein
MILAVSIIIAAALFSLRLKLQSATTLATDEAAKQRLANRLEKATLATFLPIGTGMVIVGFILATFRDSFVSIGFTIMGMAVLFLIQSQLMKRKGEALLSYAKRVRIYGQLFWWVALIAVIVLIVRIVLL